MSFSTVVQKLLAAKTLEGVKELNNEARDLHEKLCDLQVRFLFNFNKLLHILQVVAFSY